MTKENSQKSKMRNLLERTNQPILILAILAIVLYILELFHVVPASLRKPFLWLNFLIDFIFLIDLVAKVIILGRGYLKSPWFLIDLLSTLPIISSAMDLMGAVGPQLQATRVARGARVARIARVARVARLAKVARVARLATAIRAKQGLNFLKVNNSNIETPEFNRALFVGVPILLLAFVFASGYISKNEIKTFKAHLYQSVAQAQTQADIDLIRSRYDISKAINPLTESITIESPVIGGQNLHLTLEEAYIRADRLTGIMLLIVLLTIVISAAISGSLASDRGKNKVFAILSQCFSPPVVNKFYNQPEVIERFYKQWMSVFFIDIQGFTKAVEREIEDVEGLALRLRKVMDTARSQIVVTHEGVIDKFMGDAVMGWVGGHFSIHWDLMHEVRSKLCLGELEIIEQDIKSIQREIEDPDNQADEKRITELNATLAEAIETESKLKKQQKAAIANDPTLESTHQQLVTEYQRRTAKSAITCCLRISEEVSKIEDSNAFNELKIGVGSGQVLVGNFGSTNQIAFTVLGPTVNRAARLEPASAQCGCKILIDDNTYQLIKDYDDLRFRKVPAIALKGLSKVMKTYEPFLIDQVEESFLATFNLGVDAIEAENMEDAIEYFTKSNALRPGGDAASKIWLKECNNALAKGQSLSVKAIKK